MCGRAVRARSLDGYSRQVIRDRCTVSLAYDRRFFMRGVRCRPMCAGAARSLDGCSHQVIRNRCRVSLAYDRRFYMRSVRYMPIFAGVRFMQDR